MASSNVNMASDLPSLFWAKWTDMSGSEVLSKQSHAVTLRISFLMYTFRILAGTLTILTEVFHSVPQVVPWNKPDCFLPLPYQFIVIIIIII
jgi:hypothetical protein